MFEFDVYEDERRCYEYFRFFNINSREKLRERYKTDPIQNISQSAAEYIFSKFNAFKKEQDRRKQSKKENTHKKASTAVIINDLHIPEHDEKALSNVFNCIADIQPDELILNGDIIDCYWQSKFIKDPSNKMFLQEEADMFYRIFSSLRKHIPKTKITYIFGNHEDRIEKKTLEDPSFFGVKSLKLENLLRLDKLKIHVERTKYKINDDLIIWHGEKCSSRSSYSAKAEFEAHKMRTGISGHVHRLGCHYRSSDPFDTTKWIENACLCKKDPKYIKGPVDWQTGFSIVRLYQDRNPQINQIEIDNGIFEWNGILYK